MPAALELTGKTFGRLVVLSFAGKRGRARVWLCRCSCGREVVVRVGNLVKHVTKSCGCLKIEKHAGKFVTHGMCGKREYWVWADMISRCTNPNHKRFADYGGRGISVCDAWRDPQNFFACMGPRPVGGTLERENNSLGYSPDNCKWATIKQQANNKRNNHLITHDGRTQSIAQWSDETGIPYAKLKARIYRGLSTAKIFAPGRFKSGPKNAGY